MNTLVKQRRKYFIMLWVMFAIYVALFSVFIIFIEDFSLTIALIALVSIIFLFLIMPLKSRIEYYSMYINYHILYEKKAPPINIEKEILNNNWLRYLEKMGFMLESDHGDFILYYRFIRERYKSTKKDRMFQVVIIIKNKNLSFDESRYSDAINKLESIHYKKERFTKYMICHFKEYFEPLTKEDTDKLYEITCSKHGRTYFNVLNLAYLRKEGTIDFLHSDTFYPNYFFEKTVKLAKSLIRFENIRPKTDELIKDEIEE
ncbi:hypothetical protein LJC17_00120 [Acholeplasma sp. OttesenSCG-928-E16]|nr:hypothetical protein [Acholeplasma sp. OttesenSCG-928-E16]